MPNPQEPIPFAGDMLGEHRHVCAFFDGPDDEYQVTIPFIKDGIARGERTFHIVDPKLRESYEARLADAGVSAQAEKERVEIRGWYEAYLRPGHFDQNAMLALIEEVLLEGKTRGFPLTRLIAHMEWSLLDRNGVEDLVEYETRLNYVLPKYADPVICTYNTSQYNGGIIMDILRTHPAVIVGGVLRRNPFFVPPDQLLAELKTRGSRC